MIDIKRAARASMCALCAAFSFAQCAAADEIRLIDALEIMLSDNISLRSIRQEAVKAQAKRVAADGAWTPDVRITAAADAQREPQTNDGSDRSSGRSVRATLDQTIFSGGKNTALRKQAAHAANEADFRIADAENAAAGELFARFFNVLLQAERIDAERSAVATSEAHLKEIERMNELGLSNRLEVIRASGALATNRALLVTAMGEHDMAVISLMNYMAIPPEERREPKGELRVISVRGDRGESIAAALEHRADRRAAQERAKYRERQIDIARSGMMPKISLGATASWLDPYANKDRASDTWRAELTMTIPILDRNASRAEVIAERAALEQEKISVEGMDLDIRSDVEAAWTEIERTLEHLESTSSALDLAVETLRLSEVGFQEGVTPQLDLLTAQTALTEARLAHLRALYTHMIAVVALKVTEGRAVEWIEGVGQ